MVWEWLRLAPDQPRNKSYIAAHSMLRVLAFGANVFSISAQTINEELLVRIILNFYN